MSSPTPSSEDRSRRLVAWENLSRLFLDTDYTDAELDTLGEELSRTKYSLADLEDILYDEVYPVCAPNLSNPIGDWSPYGTDFLESEIAQLHVRHTTGLRRAWRRLWLRSWRGHWWPHVREAISRRDSSSS